MSERVVAGLICDANNFFIFKLLTKNSSMKGNQRKITYLFTLSFFFFFINRDLMLPSTSIIDQTPFSHFFNWTWISLPHSSIWIVEGKIDKLTWRAAPTRVIWHKTDWVRKKDKKNKTKNKYLTPLYLSRSLILVAFDKKIARKIRKFQSSAKFEANRAYTTHFTSLIRKLVIVSSLVLHGARRGGLGPRVGLFFSSPPWNILADAYDRERMCHSAAHGIDII